MDDRDFSWLAAVGLLDVVTLEKCGGTCAERLGKPVSVNHQACFKQFCWAFTSPGTDAKCGARLLTAFTEDDIEVFFSDLQEKVSRRPLGTNTCRW
jgi:hypothetical protein